MTHGSRHLWIVIFHNNWYSIFPRFNILGMPKSFLLGALKWSVFAQNFAIFHCNLNMVIRTFIKWCNLNHGLMACVESGTYLMSFKGFDHGLLICSHGWEFKCHCYCWLRKKSVDALLCTLVITYKSIKLSNFK